MNELLLKLAKKYSNGGLDFDTACEVWCDERLSSVEIRDQIRYDIGVRISSEDSVCLYNFINGIKEKLSSPETSYYDEKIKTARILPFNSEIKKRMVRAHGNVFRHKSAHIGIEWVLLEKEGENGEKTLYLARRELSQSPTKTATEVLAGSTKIDPVNGVTIKPQNCPAIVMKRDDYLKDEGGSPYCILNDKKCQHLQNSELSITEEKRDIVCDIEITK